MFPRLVLANLLLALEAVAAGNLYTVWSSVVFSRTGERTPAILGSLPTVLTPLGATEAYENGAYLKKRYFGASTTDGIGGAPIQGLSVGTINVEQVYVGTLDTQYTAASAQAFLQGFYPPNNLTEDPSDTFPPQNALANGSYIEGPLHGYQYPLIQTYGENDPEFIYLDATIQCPGFSEAAGSWELNSLEAQELARSSQPIYDAVGPVLLSEVLDPDEWNFFNAYAIFDYVNYGYIHNVSSYALLSDPASIDPSANIDYLTELRYLSDRQLFGWYGNLHATNDATSAPFSAPTGSISTIAGNYLASQILGQLQQAIKYEGQYYKLNLLFGEYQPLTSFFQLVDLPPFDDHFYGLPDFASVAAFELFSYTDGSGDAPFPSEDDLWVRFYFRNGTLGTYESYPLFGWGPEFTDMTWSDFQIAMYELVPGTDGDWCNQCAAPNLFCAFWNASDSATAWQLEQHSHRKITPAIAGVIGAAVSLAVAALVFAAVMIFGGVRFHRNYSVKNELGGYKGSQKLASDKDLIIPKGGAVVDAKETPGSPVKGGHERVGSWELKQNEAGQPNIASPAAARRPSYENDHIDDIGAAPWQKPVEADERV